MWKRILATAGAVTALASVLAAGQLHVPGDFTELQDAIDNALPGDTILVQGGVFDPITIDKPLTIVGEPRPTIRFDLNTSPGPAYAHVTLDGTGSGTLVLRNLQIGPGDLGYFHPVTQPAIFGGGFEALHLYDCQVEAASFFVPGEECCFAGRAALSTDIPQILVSHSTLLASNSDSGICIGLPPVPEPGIDAPGSTVVLLESTVEGGGQQWLCSETGCLDPDFVKTNLLRCGVRAQELFQAASTVLGGRVVSFWWDTIPGPYNFNLVSCGEGPRANPLQVAGYMPFPTRIRAFTDLRLGQTWTVLWSASGGFSTLFLSTKALLPPLEMSVGWLFVDFEGLLAPRTYQGTGIRRFDYGVPVNTSLIGVEIVGQVYDGTGLTHPIADCVGPELTALEVGTAQAL